MDFTIDELLCVCISRQVADGEVLAQGLNTPLVMAGFILAKETHAPNVKFASAIGQSLCSDWAPLGVGRIEEAGAFSGSAGKRRSAKAAADGA